MFVGTTRLPIFGSIPLLLNAGLLLLLDSSGKIVQMKLDTYGFLNDTNEQEYTLDDAIDRLNFFGIESSLRPNTHEDHDNSPNVLNQQTASVDIAHNHNDTKNDRDNDDG